MHVHGLPILSCQRGIGGDANAPPNFYRKYIATHSSIHIASDE